MGFESLYRPAGANVASRVAISQPQGVRVFWPVMAQAPGSGEPLGNESVDPQDTALPPHPPGFRGRRGRNWFFLGLLYAGYYLCRYNLGIVTPELKAEFGWGEDQLGAMSSGRDAGYAVGQFVNGLFADGMGG